MNAMVANLLNIQSSESTPIEPIESDIEQELLRNLDTALEMLQGDLPWINSARIIWHTQPTTASDLSQEWVEKFSFHKTPFFYRRRTRASYSIAKSITQFVEDENYLSSAIYIPRVDLFYEALRHTITQAFSTIHEVQSIYQDVMDNDLTFWIFTNEPQYDDELMDRLLLKEQEILDLYQNVPIMFEYVPYALCSNPQDVISQSAHNIYQV